MEYSFGDILEIKNGRNQKTVENPNGRYPIYGSGGVMGYADDYICEPNTVIIGRKGNINNPIFVSECFWNVDTAFGLQAKRDKLNPMYLYYFCRRFDFEKLNKTVTIPSLTKADILKVKINLPGLKEQESVVDKLLNVERIIDDRKKELEQFDFLIKARFVEMFGDQEKNELGWYQTTIGSCCTLKSGTSLSAEIENEGGTIPYIKVGDMNYPGNERYITTSSRFVTKETAGSGIFPVGTIMFPKRGGAIGTNKKRMTTLPVCADLNVMGVFSDGGLLPEYLMTFFEMIDLGELDNGSSVPQINNKDITPLIICVPPVEEQERFAVFTKQVDKSKVAIQKSLDETQLLFDSLMQEYFG